MSAGTTRPVVLAVVLTLLVLAVGGLLFMYSGVYNVAATEDHTAVMRWALGTTMERSVAARADEVPEPPPVDSAMVAHGFAHFRSMCVVCHGAPGVERGEFGKGMTPTPPPLREEAEELSSRELFWVVKHGIKMAGMPGFGPTHSDEEIWGIVAFVERLPELGEEGYARWEERYAQDSGSAAGGAAAEDAAAADEGAASGSGGGHSQGPGAAEHSH